MAWTQVGNDIDAPTSSYSKFGYRVSTNNTGDIIAVYCQSTSTYNIYDIIRIYKWNGSLWSNYGNINIGTDANDTNNIGDISLSDNGNRIAVSQTTYDTGGTNIGITSVYYDNGSGSYIQLGNAIVGEASNDESGSSISLNNDGTRLAIGSPNNDGSGSNAGSTRIFEYNGTAWIQLGGDIDGEASEDYSGYSVSLNSDGSRVAIGAILNDGNGVSSGSVRIYQWNGTSWIQLGNDIDGEASGDYSGWSVSFNGVGDIVAIGAIYNDGINGADSGQVRIYKWNGTSWNQLGSDIDGEGANDASGYSVSLNNAGTKVAIGAIFNDGNGNNSGHTRVYQWNGTSWVQDGQDIDGEAAGDLSGQSVALNNAGDRVVIGAIWNDNASGTDKGQVRVFTSFVATTTTTTTTTGTTTTTTTTNSPQQVPYVPCRQSNKQFSVLQLRRGLNADFISSNIILASGEPGWATDLKILKIGDGTTPWNNLIALFSSGTLSTDNFGGTSGTIPLYTTASSLGNSIITQSNNKNINVSGNYLNVSSGILVNGSGYGTIDISMNPRYYDGPAYAASGFGQAPTIKLVNSQYKSWGPGIYLEYYGNVVNSGDLTYKDIETPRLGFMKGGGTKSSPTFLEGWEALSIIRTAAPSSGDATQVVSRIVSFADGSISGFPYQPSKMRFEITSGSGVLDKYLQINSKGNITTNCSMSIGSGLSVPTLIYDFGNISGNTAISYDINKQIQSVTLNGSSVNFTKGYGWNLNNQSVDVILKMTVLSNTTVTFDSGFVTDWYSSIPVFISGEYSFLFRSMGSSNIQGYYIGKKV